MIRKFAIVLGLVVCASALQAATNGSDNAANYGGGWTNGSNGGTGFAPWSFTNNDDGSTTFAGNFLGDSTAGSGNINTSGVSFGIYANPGNAFENANRNFDSSLLSAQTFSFDLAVNFRNGNKGFNLYDGGTEVFNFNVGSDLYSINGTDTGLTYDAASVFHFSFTQTSLAGGSYSVSRGASMFAGSYTGDASGFRFYNSGTDSGDNANNLYFNNLSIVPEPSTLSLLAAPAILGAWFFIRRRRA